MATTSLQYNLGKKSSLTATYAAFYAAHSLDVDPIKLDQKLLRLCGGYTPDYMTARRFVFEGSPDFQTICTRYQIRIDIIKAKNKQRGQARARQIARDRAGVLADLPY